MRVLLSFLKSRRRLCFMLSSFGCMHEASAEVLFCCTVVGAFSHVFGCQTSLETFHRTRNVVSLRQCDLSRWILCSKCPLTTRNGARHENKITEFFFLTAFMKSVSGHCFSVSAGRENAFLSLCSVSLHWL